MKVNFLTDNKVEVTLEIKSTYSKDVSQRKFFGNFYVMEEFSKLHPNKKIEEVLVSSELNNFSKTGTVSGTWIFKLEQQEVVKEVKSAKKQTQKTRKRKNLK